MLENQDPSRPLEIQSPNLHVGDLVTLDRDVLAEVAREAAGLPPTWFCVPAGTRGRLIGWRDREEDGSRAVIDLDGVDHRIVVFMRESHVTRSRRGHVAPRVQVAAISRRSYRSRHRG